jgi:hypothetical protein
MTASRLLQCANAAAVPPSLSLAAKPPPRNPPPMPAARARGSPPFPGSPLPSGWPQRRPATGRRAPPCWPPRHRGRRGGPERSDRPGGRGAKGCGQRGRRAGREGRVWARHRRLCGANGTAIKGGAHGWPNKYPPGCTLGVAAASQLNLHFRIKMGAPPLNIPPRRTPLALPHPPPPPPPPERPA